MGGFNEPNTLYPKGPDFVEAWKVGKELVTLDMTRWLDDMFKGIQLCSPRISP